jgi:hypothetical protein
MRGCMQFRRLIVFTKQTTWNLCLGVFFCRPLLLRSGACCGGVFFVSLRLSAAPRVEVPAAGAVASLPSHSSAVEKKQQQANLFLSLSVSLSLSLSLFLSLCLHFLCLSPSLSAAPRVEVPAAGTAVASLTSHSSAVEKKSKSLSLSQSVFFERVER